jgi:hypothetical protein
MSGSLQLAEGWIVGKPIYKGVKDGSPRYFLLGAMRLVERWIASR